MNPKALLALAAGFSAALEAPSGYKDPLSSAPKHVAPSPDGPKRTRKAKRRAAEASRRRNRGRK